MHSTVPPGNRGRRPRVTLERLLCDRPSRLQDCRLDGDALTPVTDHPRPPAGATDVTCWTPVDDRQASPDPEPRATLIAEPALGDDTTVTHTLVLEIDGPTRSIAVDYRPLDTTVIPERGVRVRTDDDDAVTVREARLTDGGQFVATVADPPSDGALFVEYAVSENPASGRHSVEVTVDGERQVEVRLVVLG